MVELDKVGGTCLHRGCVPAKEFLETAAVYRTVRGSARFGINVVDGDPPAPDLDFAVSQARKQTGGGPAVARAGGPAEGSRRDHLQRQRHPAARPPGPDHRQRRQHLGDHRERHRAGGRLGAPHDPRLRCRRLAGADIRRGPRPRAATRHRWRSSGAGPSAASSPRSSPIWGARSRCSRRCRPSSPAATRTWPRRSVRSFRKRGIDVKAGARLEGHTPDPSGKGTVVAYGEGEKLAVDAVVVSVGRRPYTEGLPRRGDRRGDRRPGVRRGRPLHAHHRGRGLGGGRRGCRHPAAGPRRVRRGDRGDQGDPRRAGRARSTTTGCPGPSTAIPRWPSPG